ncbi:MAG: HpaII family restriction endonuclease [Phocaeicola sp.]
MALKGNKGEWSEVYAFFKLLGEGKVYAGDEYMNKISDLFYPIISILRREKEGDMRFSLEEQEVSVQNYKGEELLRLKASSFLEQADKLLAVINSSSATFTAPDSERFLESLDCYTLKAKPIDKADIRLVLHDRRTRMNAKMGFSIKSQLGSDSTLLNAGKTTNVTYRIEGVQLSEKEVEAINSTYSAKDKVLKRVDAIKAAGGRFLFHTIDNRTFHNNLTLIDSSLPEIVGHLLLTQLEIRKGSLNELCDAMVQTNPLGFDIESQIPFYSYKLKQLLIAAALGMVPAKPWGGQYDANGGYLVVKSGGDVLCYHFYDRNRFEEYLFRNSYLERASTTRHAYAQLIREEDGTLYFKLNLQIRLK